MPTSEISSPLANIVRKAAQAKVEGPAAKVKKRFEDASMEMVILVDCSGSMNDWIGSSDKSKIEHAQIALADVLKGWPRAKIVGFGSWPALLQSPSEINARSFGGGTDLAAALRFAAAFKPFKTIVICDGMPNNEQDALLAADDMTGSIDTIYCGPDGMTDEVTFLRSLSRCTGGTSAEWNGMQELASTVRGMLPAPSEAIILG